MTHFGLVIQIIVFIITTFQAFLALHIKSYVLFSGKLRGCCLHLVQTDWGAAATWHLFSVLYGIALLSLPLQHHATQKENCRQQHHCQWASTCSFSDIGAHCDRKTLCFSAHHFANHSPPLLQTSPHSEILLKWVIEYKGCLCCVLVLLCRGNYAWGRDVCIGGGRDFCMMGSVLGWFSNVSGGQYVLRSLCWEGWSVLERESVVRG